MCDSRTASALGAAVALCFPISAMAQAPSPTRDSGARGAGGAIVQFVEAPGSAILYLEETGGMVSTVPGAVPAVRGGASPPAQPARKTEAAAQQPSTRRAPPGPLVQRRLEPFDGVVAKP